MINNFATTIYFKEIFPDWETWREWSYELLQQGDQLDEDFDRYCYKLLFRHFANQNIRYGTAELFKLALENVYLNKYEKYIREVELIKVIYNLTLEDLEKVASAISNSGKNSNSDIDPEKPIGFVSEQVYTKQLGNKIDSYIRALESLSSLNMYNFINGSRKERQELQFIDLFMNIQPKNDYLYNKGGE